jgi:hypothetical protein
MGLIVELERANLIDCFRGTETLTINGKYYKFLKVIKL